MSGPKHGSAPTQTASPPGASTSTNGARRPSNVPSPTPSNSTVTAMPASAGCLPLPASACSPPPPRTSRKSLSPSLPGRSWPDSTPRHRLPTNQNKTPPKIGGVCQRSEKASVTGGLYFLNRVLGGLDRPCADDLPGRLGLEHHLFAREGVGALARLGRRLLDHDELREAGDEENPALLQLLVADIDERVQHALDVAL